MAPVPHGPSRKCAPATLTVCRRAFGTVKMLQIQHELDLLVIITKYGLTDLVNVERIRKLPSYRRQFLHSCFPQQISLKPGKDAIKMSGVPLTNTDRYTRVTDVSTY